MSEGIAQFGDLLATLLANEQYPEGYDEGSLRDLLGQLDPGATSIDTSVADRLEDLAGKLATTPARLPAWIRR